MYLLHSRNPWSYQEHFEVTLSFCLWVLQSDGLHVPPFDQHPDGDGSLRALGLTAEDWQAWFLRVLDPKQKQHDIEQIRQRLLTEYLQISGEPDLEHLGQRYQAEHLKISTTPPLPPPPEFHFHHASWQGNSAVRDRLIELEKEYLQISGQLDILIANLSRERLKEEHRTGTNLYDELHAYATRLPSLTTYLAVYDYPLDYILPPTTILITIQESQPEPQEYRERVLAAATKLVTPEDQRGKRSLYTRIGQSTATYRRHERKPIPSPLPRQTLPRLTDPARQAVLSELENQVFHGIVDLTSVQFLREKQRPGWRLYEVTYQESDGEQQQMIFILQQNEDGSWLNIGGGNSTDVQNLWSRDRAPVHDHPLLFLTANWIVYNHHHYLLTAYGHVIANGFSVEQVRLVNDMGQVLEDTVENGYIFFACKAEQLVQLPMQAELIDRQGKLMWKQTIPESGLPSSQK